MRGLTIFGEMVGGRTQGCVPRADSWRGAYILYVGARGGFTLGRTILYRAFFFVIPSIGRRIRKGQRSTSEESCVGCTTEHQMPFLPPPSFADDRAPDDYPDVDKRSCRLLGPTALVRTNRRSHPDVI